MGIKFLLLIALAFIMIGYYLYVLYRTLQYKRKYGRTADAQDLYLRTRAFHLLLFGKLFKNESSSKYKILKNEEEEDKASKT